MFRKLRSLVTQLLDATVRKPRRRALRRSVESHFPGEALARELVDAVFLTRKLDRELIERLIAAARGTNSEPWRLRCLAVVLLEYLVWRLREDAAEQEWIGDRLGLNLPEPAEGYTATDRKCFVQQLRRRMARLDHLHHAVDRSSNEPDFSAFVALADQECRLTLARYVFSAEDVFARVTAQMEESQGVKHVKDRGRATFDAEAESAIAQLPALEAVLIRSLLSGERVYWVAGGTSSRLNSIVEYPLTSAVLVIKPPGSCVELEIKRAGVRGLRRFTVIYNSLNGDGVAPVSHRLHGSSFGWLGRREAEAASLFSTIYRLVHGEAAPLCLTLSIVSPQTVLGPSGETHILDYLTSEPAFGQGFDNLLSAMREAIDRLPVDTGVQVYRYRGAMGLTLQFLAQALPQQALLLNTTSFRLDRLALYLSPEGPVEYFERGLKTPYTRSDARQLADTVLSEILGVYVRPRGRFQNYGKYIRRAFAVPANRARANANFLECMRQVGHFWGTLLGVRGYTDGESFVSRNAGIRCVWDQGEWRVRMIFMDHDDLWVLGRKKLRLWPYRAVHGMYRDSVHVLGGGDTYKVKGEVGFLRDIYAVDDATYAAGLTAFRDALRAAYRRTQLAVESDDRLRSLFFEPFAAELRDWDTVARIRLDAAKVANWKTEAAEYLKSRSYDPDLIQDYVNTAEDFPEFLNSTSFLWERR